jgi:hypothetical protein
MNYIAGDHQTRLGNRSPFIKSRAVDPSASGDDTGRRPSLLQIVLDTDAILYENERA